MKLDPSAVVAVVNGRTRGLLTPLLFGVVVAVAATVSGCATRGVPSTSAVSTTALTSAEVGENNAPTPKVGKVQRASRLAGRLEAKDETGEPVVVKDRDRRYGVFGDRK